MEAGSLQALPIVLALELAAGEHPRQPTLGRDDAAELAELIAADLQALVPAVATARLALAGALFDTVELLRPGFPVWATLDEFSRRVPRGHLEGVLALGSHDGHMPAQVLEPDVEYNDGPMRLLPLSLLVPESLAATLAEALEVELVGRGEAGALTADWLMRNLGLRLEHARYLSRNDLLALTCVQYEHVNLAPLWQLLEAALLTPYREETVLTARGLGLRYADGKIFAQTPTTWLDTQHGNANERAHALAGIMFELRQYAALLSAHGLAVRLEGAHLVMTEAGYLLDEIATADSAYDPPSLFAHEAPGLGVVVVSVAQRGPGGRPKLLAHAYPLRPNALAPLLSTLAERFGAPAELHALGRILLDEHGLTAPFTPLH